MFKKYSELLRENKELHQKITESEQEVDCLQFRLASREHLEEMKRKSLNEQIHSLESDIKQLRAEIEIANKVKDYFKGLYKGEKK